MNKKRKEDIGGVIMALKLCIETIGEVRKDEREYVDMMPTKLRSSERGEREAGYIHIMNRSEDVINDAIDGLEVVTE